MVTALIAVLLFAALLIHVLYCYDTTEHINRIATRLESRIVMSTQDTIDTIVAQLGHAKTEIVGKIADVQAQLDAASVPAETVDLTALTAAAQALDDIVPDPVVVTPPADVPADVPPVASDGITPA